MSEFSKESISSFNINAPVRINKYLSDSGFCSRRQADRLIEEGRVFIDGKPALTGSKVCPEQKVTVDGKSLARKSGLVLLAFNKPVGIECTTDKNNPANIIDFINYPERIYPIGRLDKNSSGLILLTNTGELVNGILRSSNKHEKEYIVELEKPVTKDFINKLKNGVFLKELNVKTRKCEAEITGRKTIKIILTQGLNRQIRRMCETLDNKVVSLKRVRIMNITLGRLAEGSIRTVSEKELAKLLDDLGLRADK